MKYKINKNVSKKNTTDFIGMKFFFEDLGWR